MYCMKCGVKLADTEKLCPLCGLAVFHPDLSREAGEPLYPQQRAPSYQVSAAGGRIVETAAVLLPLLITLLCDLQIGLIVTAVVALLRYVRRGRLYIFGGAAIGLGAFMPLMEYLIYITFDRPRFTAWSLYPLTALVLLGGTLIFLAICRPARETMERKFFL